LQGRPATFDAVSARQEATNVRKKSWLLHHDNALAHSALSIREFFAKNNIAGGKSIPTRPGSL